VVICLESGADCLHMVQLMPLRPEPPSSLASFKSRLVLPFWYRPTQVVLEKRPLNGCSVVVVVGLHLTPYVVQRHTQQNCHGTPADNHRKLLFVYSCVRCVYVCGS